MGQKGSEKKWNWLLRPGVGLGLINIGDNISNWQDLLRLKPMGDLDARLERYFKEGGYAYESSPYLQGDDFSFESDRFDISFRTDALMNIKKISAVECCIFKGNNLINSNISEIKAIWGFPSWIHNHSFGFTFFYDEIGVAAQFNESRRVAWIEIYAPEDEAEDE